jgi:CRISPR-associated protein Csm2
MKLKMLRPNLAYVAARQDKNVDGKKVIALIENLVRDVQTPEQLENFKTFMEALVAYHKYYGK